MHFFKVESWTLRFLYFHVVVSFSPSVPLYSYVLFKAVLKFIIFIDMFSAFLLWNALDHLILSIFWTLLKFYYLMCYQSMPCTLRTETHTSLALTESRARPTYNICCMKFVEWNEDTSWYASISRARWLLEISEHYR